MENRNLKNKNEKGWHKSEFLNFNISPSPKFFILNIFENHLFQNRRKNTEVVILKKQKILTFVKFQFQRKNYYISHSTALTGTIETLFAITHTLTAILKVKLWKWYDDGYAT